MSKIKSNGDCSILEDICPYLEEERPCKKCPRFLEYEKHKEKVKKFWEEESVREAIMEEAYEYEQDLEDGYSSK